jgi:serine/threonine-protein kinase
MGVVFEGRDERLDRSVAIKSLPEHFSDDPERLARFEREARLLASLSHPNLASVYGLEEQDGARYLVMEFIEGHALSELLSQGPLAFDEALRIAAQVAAGVECAHEAGVIHRDLKPANIVVTPSGQAKVLDFGLAREIEGRSSSMNLTEQVTASMGYETVRQTGAGQIMGTAAYLSPEQARGKRLDKRTDVWSFGCVLFEMLTGLSPYAGETMTDSLGAILHKEPAWNQLPPELPATVVHLLRRLLVKDPDRRLRDLGDARIEIEETLRDPGSTRFMSMSELGELKERRGSRPMLGWIAAAVIALVAGYASWVAWLMPHEADDPIRVRVSLREPVPGEDEAVFELADEPGRQFAISPDGRTLVFAGEDGNARSQLYIRSMDQFDATPMSGTEGAEYPFFSPDGQWIGYVSQTALKKVSVSGGSSIRLCDVGNSFRGASWGDDGRIYIAPNTTDSLWVVSEAGGEPEKLSELDEANDERSHRWPFVLPGSKAVLFTMQRPGESFDEATIEAIRLDTKERIVLHRGGTNPAYLPSGHLVFGKEGTLFASRFDPETLALGTTPSPVIDGITTNTGNGGVDYDFSDSGVMMYLVGEEESFATQARWVSRDGTRAELDGEKRTVSSARLSPDGTRLVYQFYNEEGSSYDIWVYEIARGVMSRLTFNEDDDMSPAWSPDSEHIVYSEVRTAPRLVMKRADGSEEGVPLTPTEGDGGELITTPQFATDWSDDGSYIIYHESYAGTGWDLRYLDMSADPPTEHTFLATEYVDYHGALSPDGKWIAYASNETGPPEIYIRPFPEGGGRWQVSTGGGNMPRWSADGTELFYLTRTSAMSAAIEFGDASVRVSTAEELFTFELAEDFFNGQYDPMPGGDGFMILEAESRQELRNDSLSVVFNWFTDIERKLENAR